MSVCLLSIEIPSIADRPNTVDILRDNGFQRIICPLLTASVVQWSEFVAAIPEVEGSIPDATLFSA
jgi:hypothetical protein